MLHLIIGGRGSGKHERLLSLGLKEEDISDGKTTPFSEIFSRPALEHLEGLVRRYMEGGRDSSEIMNGILAGIVSFVSCDEVGSGIVPTDEFEIRYREEVGRLCCKIAEKADIVERLYCGIPMVLKGNPVVLKGNVS